MNTINLVLEGNEFYRVRYALNLAIDTFEQRGDHETISIYRDILRKLEEANHIID